MADWDIGHPSEFFHLSFLSEHPSRTKSTSTPTICLMCHSRPINSGRVGIFELHQHIKIAACALFASNREAEEPKIAYAVLLS